MTDNKSRAVLPTGAAGGSQCADVVTRTIARFDRIEGLINNAGPDLRAG